jgi:transposase-like protein
MKRKSGAPAIYAEKDKIAIAREYLTGTLSHSQLAAKYGIENKETVRHFVYWYKKHYPDSEIIGSSSAAAAQVAQTSQQARPTSKESKDKDKQLQEAHLKIAALEMLIANAKKELGIDLIKKSGTKQSNK